MSETNLKIIKPNFPDKVGKTDIPMATMANAMVALDAMHVQCSYDVFHDRRIIGGWVLGSQVGQVSDDVCLLFRKLCRVHFTFDPGKDHTWDAINLRCRENSFHPILNYLSGLEWDGVERIGTWLIDYMGAADTPFNRAVGAMQLVASVRRVMEPGCKYDYMSVLESPEGYDKSKSLEALYGAENFSDQSIFGLSDKELAEAVRGRWGMEAADLSGMPRGEVEKIKAQLSRTIDRTRPAYGRATLDVPRCHVFWGSTNDDVYLRSQHGNRRFLPVKIGRIDYKAIVRDRDQLWAEAAALEGLGGPLALPEHLWAAAGAEQAKRTKQDPWADTLADISTAAAGYERDKDATAPVHYDRKDKPEGEVERVTSAWLMDHGLRIVPDRQSSDLASRLRLVMTKLGWTYADVPMRIGGRLARGYWRLVAPFDADFM
jgi:hypothetical protein